MAVPAKHKPKVGALVPTKTTGIYYRFKSDGTKTFYVRYTRPDNRRAFEAAGSFEAAKARLAEVQGRISKGEVVGDPTTTLRQVIADWRVTRAHVKPRTRVKEDEHIRVHFGPLLGLRVREINKAKVLGWLAAMQRHDGKPGSLNDGTKAGVLATLSSVLDYAVDDDIISVNPCKALGRKQKPKQDPDAEKARWRVLTKDEADRLVKGVGRQEWMSYIIRFALLSGLRLGEVAGLRWQDVDFRAGTITVERQLGKEGKFGTPKGGVTASIPMVRAVRSLLAEMRLKGAARSAPSRRSSRIGSSSTGNPATSSARLGGRRSGPGSRATSASTTSATHASHCSPMRRARSCRRCRRTRDTPTSTRR